MKKITLSILSLTLVLSSFAQVTINEVQADNDATYADLGGNYEDWVEFYNAGSSEVDMSGWMCIDDNTKDSTDWYVMPAGTMIAPGEYLVMFCNSDTGFTTGFGLSKNGDGFFLMNEEGIVDSTTFGAIDADMSWARATDGAGAWAVEETPTPGAANSEVNSIATLKTASLKVYPNPTTDGTVHFGKVLANVTVYDITGSVVSSATNVSSISIDTTGLYFVRSTAEGLTSIARVVVK
jgi:hypothetical protein